MRLLLLSIVTFYIFVIEPRCFVGNRTHNVAFENLKVGTSFCSFEIHYTSDKCDSEPDVVYAVASTPKNMDDSFAKCNYTCYFTDLTTKCVCEGDNCNNITNAKLILAKEFARTNSSEISKIILCFLADGEDFGYFNLATVTPATATKESIITTVTVETMSDNGFEKESKATTTEMITTGTEISGHLTTSLQTSGSGGPEKQERSYYESEIRENEPPENENAFQALLNNEVIFFCVFGWIMVLLLLLISIFFTLTLSYVVKTRKFKSKEKTTDCES